jgi:hypothetical protein
MSQRATAPAKKRVPLTDAQKAAKKADAAKRFIELANKRGNKVLDALAILGNCSNPGYEYNPEQITKLFGVIGEAVVTCRARFDQPTRSKRGTLNIVGPEEAADASS